MVAVERRTTCSRDCPDACGILASVEEGRVVALRGDPGHPVTRGFLCFRTSRYLDLQNSPERIRQPLLRRHGRHVPIAWDEAFDLLTERLRRIRAESGPAAIAHYRSGGSLGLLKGLIDRFFDEFGPCTGKVGDICSGAGEAAQIQDFGTSDSNDLFDLLHSRHILLWGKNPVVSSVHLVPVLKQAREGGARLLLIDPVRHKTLHHVDRYLQPVPGGDLELALGVARLLFETGRVVAEAEQFCDGLPAFRALCHQQTAAQWAAAAGVQLADLQHVADVLADGPTAILVGWGMQRRQRGAAIVRALDALCALSGNLFRSGGGCSFYFKRRKAFAKLGEGVKPPRLLREPLLGLDLMAAKDPPVRMLWVTAGNPVAMLPGAAQVAQAIESLEFVVVADTWMTDTAARAHLVLPVPSLLEDDDLLGAYGHHWLGESRGVVPPPDGVRHEVHLFQELARRLGVTGYPQDPLDELKRQYLAPVAAQGASLEDLRQEGAVRSPASPRLLFADGLVLTPNGRVQLLSAMPDPVAIEPPPARPEASAQLWLFSNSTEKSQASVWSGKGLGDALWVAVHPDALPGTVDGAPVWIESPAGELAAVLRHDPGQRPDVAIVPKGGHYDRGQCANALIAARPTDQGLGAAYLDCLVRIRPR